MKENEKEKLRDMITSIQPYLTSTSNLEKTVEKLIQKSVDLEDFKNNFGKIILKEEDPTIKADYKILLNKLESR